MGITDLINIQNPIGSAMNLYDMFTGAGKKKSEPNREPAAKKKGRTTKVYRDKKKVAEISSYSDPAKFLGKNVSVHLGGDDPNDRIHSIYEEMQKNATKRGEERTDSIRKMMNEQQNILQNSQAQVNLRPTAQFVDAMTGSNFAAGYEAPTQTMKNMARVDALQGVIEQQKEGVFKDNQAALLAEMKSRQAMENAKKNAEAMALKLGAALGKPGKAGKVKDQKNMGTKARTSLQKDQKFLRLAGSFLTDLRANKRFVGWGKGVGDFGAFDYVGASIEDAKDKLYNVLGKYVGMEKPGKAVPGEEMSLANIGKARQALKSKLDELVLSLAKTYEERLSNQDKLDYAQIMGNLDRDPAILAGKILKSMGNSIDGWNAVIDSAEGWNENTGGNKRIDKQAYLSKYTDLLMSDSEDHSTYKLAHPTLYREQEEWRNKNKKAPAVKRSSTRRRMVPLNTGVKRSTSTKALRRANITLKIKKAQDAKRLRDKLRNRKK